VLIRRTGELADSYKLMEHFINKYYRGVPLLVVHGGARGADTLAGIYADKHGCEVKLFPADWENEGQAAGPLRNKRMVAFCDECVCFWDGRSTGTEDTINRVQHSGKMLRVFRGWEPYDYRPVVRKKRQSD